MNRQEGKRNQRCEEIKRKLNEVNKQIAAHEKTISVHKEKAKNFKQEKDIIKAEMKNMMTKYGVSLDYVADAFIPNPLLAIAKGSGDILGSPSAKRIEEMMKKIQKKEMEISKLEQKIMELGQKIRSLVFQRDDLVQDWRYSGCGRNGL